MTAGTDVELAASLATAAGELLLDLRASGIDPDKLGDEADLRSNELLLEGLAPTGRPTPSCPRRGGRHRTVDASRVWIIDPLDGTREFSESRRTDWAVHVGLWAGALPRRVALPARGWPARRPRRRCRRPAARRDSR